MSSKRNKIEKLEIEGAIFSVDKRYRYALYRSFDPAKKKLLMIGLNPSKANKLHNDPTIRRCIGFAKGWNFGALYVANLFAFCATHPKDLFEEEKPIGPFNNQWLSALIEHVDCVVLMYGNQGAYMHQAKQLLSNYEVPWYCIKMTKLNISSD